MAIIFERQAMTSKNYPFAIHHFMKLSALFACIGLSACSTIGIETKDTATLLLAERSNIVTGKNISNSSAGTLLNAGIKEDECFDDFNKCITEVNDSIFPATNTHSLSQLAVMAELHYTQSKNITKSKACKVYFSKDKTIQLNTSKSNGSATNKDACINNYQSQLIKSINYSYAYLFYNDLNSIKPQSHLPNERDIQTLDIYNGASTELISYLYDNQQKNKVDTAGKKITTKMGETKVVIHLPNNPQTAKQYSQINKLTPTVNIQLKGLNSISKQAGVGVNYVAKLNGRYQDTLQNRLQNDDENPNVKKDLTDPNSRIFATGNILITAVTQPTGNTQKQVLSSKQLNIYLYDPYQKPSTNILGAKYPLTANFSASYGSWIEENQLEEVTYLNLLSQRGQQTLPYLFMLEPYNPNKQVIIMLHGLASSPITWVTLTNDIFNDEALREHFQVWQVFYPTNMPMLENRYQIQTLIETAYQNVGANRTTAAGNNSVLIGHSMGGVISRLMLSNNDLTKGLTELNDIPLNNNAARNASNDLFNSYQQPNQLLNRFKLNAIPQVDTAVFIAAPHRGTEFADLWFTRALRKIISMPVALSNILDNEAGEELAKTPLGSLFLQNGASQLSDESAFMQLTDNVDIAGDVTYHSIMGKLDNDLINRLELIETDQGSDGIVPYKSSHLEGAKSETILAGSHNIHTNPKTILQLRKILHEHMAKHPIK